MGFFCPLNYILTLKIERITGMKTQMMNFDDNITDKHGVIVKNWPLPIFCAPGDIHTVTELKILYNAWESGTTHFYQMTIAKATKCIERHSTSSLATAIPLATPTDQDPSSQESQPLESGTGDTNATAVNRSEQVDRAVSNSTEDATLSASEHANPNSMDPAVSKQTIVTNASVPSLPTLNLNPSSSSPSAP